MNGLWTPQSAAITDKQVGTAARKQLLLIMVNGDIYTARRLNIQLEP